jgi:asparagine synthase (glutamine-hydrolysing)
VNRRLAGVFDRRRGKLALPLEEGVETVEGLLCRFDGHLDNAPWLRSRLESGSLPREASEEELVAAGYRRWGEDVLDRLRGDFALLIWDGERREGLLARDQLGVRPVYLHRGGDLLSFAGELRDLLDLLPSSPAPDRAGVAHWIALSSRPGCGTLYEGVERVGPGELLRFGRGRAPQRRRYWQPRFQEPLELPPAELAERVRETLSVAVKRRLDETAETGVLMSGGLDSAAIAALGAPAVRACSGTFPEHPEADEAELIVELRRELGLEGVTVEVRPGGLLASALEHLDQWRAPLLGWGDFWAVPLLRAAAARGVGTMLDGEGGDELFGPRGYLLADELRRGHPRRVLELSRCLPGAGPHVGRRREAAMLEKLALAGAAPARPPGWRLQPGRAGAPRWLTRRTVAELRHSDDVDAWKRLDGPRWWAHAAHGIAYGIESVGVFEQQRRRAQMAGLDARQPMLDLDLVELGLRQPPEATLDPRFTRPVLRAAMQGLLPDSVRLRPRKALFESLIASCLAGPDGAAVRGILTAPDAELREHVDHRRMARELFAGEKMRREDPFRWMWSVWRLLNAELWLRSLRRGNGAARPDLRVSSRRIEVVAHERSYLFPT